MRRGYASMLEVAKAGEHQNTDSTDHIELTGAEKPKTSLKEKAKKLVSVVTVAALAGIAITNPFGATGTLMAVGGAAIAEDLLIIIGTCKAMKDNYCHAVKKMDLEHAHEMAEITDQFEKEVQRLRREYYEYAMQLKGMATLELRDKGSQQQSKPDAGIEENFSVSPDQEQASAGAFQVQDSKKHLAKNKLSHYIHHYGVLALGGIASGVAFYREAAKLGFGLGAVAPIGAAIILEDLAITAGTAYIARKYFKSKLHKHRLELSEEKVRVIQSYQRTIQQLSESIDRLRESASGNLESRAA